ncbi:MAG: hypothetical protein QXL15_02045 [Candidatus Korarchaeota archaeon]
MSADAIISAVEELKSVANVLRNKIDQFIQEHEQLHSVISSKIGSLESRISGAHDVASIGVIQQEIAALKEKIFLMETKIGEITKTITTSPVSTQPTSATTPTTYVPTTASVASTPPASVASTPPASAPATTVSSTTPASRAASPSGDKIIIIPPSVLPETPAEAPAASELGFDKLIQLIKSNSQVSTIANELLRLRDTLQQQYRSTAFFEMNKIAQHLTAEGEGRLDGDSARRLLKKIGEWELRILKKWV